MTQDAHSNFELDERFPTGEWKGFWLQRRISPNRQRMDLALEFEKGHVRGDGRDIIGEFTMSGRYDVKSGKVIIKKFYIGQHQVLYEGWAESDKGIWGVWTIRNLMRDGFHIWPKGMKDPTRDELKVELDVPVFEEGSDVLIDEPANEVIR